jgi:hypothetical protein
LIEDSGGKEGYAREEKKEERKFKISNLRFEREPQRNNLPQRRRGNGEG